MKLKAAVVGLGKMGISHASILGAQPNVDLVAICDSSSLVLDVFKKYTNSRVYSDYQKLFTREELDFVVIATPTKFHYPMVKEALQRGIHVFCEKPFSLHSKEGEELVRIAKEKNLNNQVGYHNQFIGTFRELHRLLQKGVLGRIVHFSGEAYGPVVTREKGSTWRSRPEEGGGCTLDYASHVVNLIQHIIAPPTKINGTLLKSIYSKGVDDAVYSLLTLENNISGTLLVNWSEDTYRKMSTSITVMGTKGKIICDATEIKIHLKEENVQENLPKGWLIKYITDFAIPVNFYLRGEEYSAQLEYFIDNISNKQLGSYNTFEHALITDKVMEMILTNGNLN